MSRAAAVASPREVKDQAHALALKGRFDAAMRVIDAHLQRDAADPSLWLQHAELSRKLRRVDLAVSSYRQAARLLLRAGHLPRARAALLCAQQLAPRDVSVLADLARVAAESRPPPRLRLAPAAPPELPPVATAPREADDEPLFAPPPPLPYERDRVTRLDRRRPPVVALEDEPPTDPYNPVLDWAPQPVSASATSSRRATAPASGSSRTPGSPGPARAPCASSPPRVGSPRARA